MTWFVASQVMDWRGSGVVGVWREAAVSWHLLLAPLCCGQLLVFCGAPGTGVVGEGVDEHLVGES